MKSCSVVTLIPYVIGPTIVSVVVLASCVIAPVSSFVTRKVVSLTRFGVTIFAASFLRRRLTLISAARSSSSPSSSSMKIAGTRTGRR